MALATWSRRLDLADDEDLLVAQALRDRGLEPVQLIWDHDALDADICVIRTTWDYFERREDFVAWLETAERRCPVWNPARVIRWNLHKRYLIELAARGVPTPATVLLAGGEDPSRVARDRGWSRVMIKPAVGVGAIGSAVADISESARIREHVADLARRGDVLIQEYLATVHTVGECSLIYFDGRFSHAVRKVPAAGDYRAHPYWGATVEPMTPSPAQLDAASLALAQVPEAILYARVDMLERADGTPALIELELIEPYLFLDAASADVFAEGIVARLQS